MPDDRHGSPSSHERLGRFWDDLSRGQPPGDAALDAELGATIVRFHEIAGRDPGRGPDPRFVERLKEELMAASSQPLQTPQLLLVEPIGAPNGMTAWPSPQQWRISAPRRGRWMMAQVATAALVLLTLAGSFFVFGPGRFGRQQEPPAFVPAIVATPATPAPDADKPVAELLWQSEGNPDLPLADPANLAIDAQGNIWVTDGRNSRFQIFAPDGTFLEAWGTPGEGEGELDFVEAGLFGGYGAGSMEFDATGNLYVVDPGNYRIQKFGPDRGFVTAWGSRGSEDGEFLAVLDLAIDGQGQVYVVDEMRGDVQLFDSDGRFLSVWSNGAEEWAGKPSGITIDGEGTLWVNHFQRNAVQHYAPDGSLLASWDESGIEAGEFGNPSGVSVDDEGRVFVNEWANNRIQVFDGDGTFLATWGGLGRADAEFSFSGLNGSVLDGEGNIYVVQDGNDLIKKFRLLPPLAPAAATADGTSAGAGEIGPAVRAGDATQPLPVLAADLAELGIHSLLVFRVGGACGTAPRIGL